MKNVLALSQKGGVGKTTIADNLAFMLEADGNAVTFYDLDPQGGALHDTTETPEAAFAVIDTPGAITEDTQDMIADADLIVIPTRASALDMPPLERTRGGAGCAGGPGYDRYQRLEPLDQCKGFQRVA